MTEKLSIAWTDLSVGVRGFMDKQQKIILLTKQIMNKINHFFNNLYLI